MFFQLVEPATGSVCSHIDAQSPFIDSWRRTIQVLLIQSGRTIADAVKATTKEKIMKASTDMNYFKEWKSVNQAWGRTHDTYWLCVQPTTKVDPKNRM